jgi:hypothetical protein
MSSSGLHSRSLNAMPLRLASAAANRLAHHHCEPHLTPTRIETNKHARAESIEHDKNDRLLGRQPSPPIGILPLTRAPERIGRFRVRWLRRAVLHQRNRSPTQRG